MTEKQPNVISINDKDYTEDQLTSEQKAMINHIADLDRKIRSAQFNLDQLTVGRDAFVRMVSASVENQPEQMSEEVAAE